MYTIDHPTTRLRKPSVALVGMASIVVPTFPEATPAHELAVPVETRLPFLFLAGEFIHTSSS